MDSPYFFYNREHPQDSPMENNMALICVGRISEFEMLILGEHDKLAANSMGTLILTPETHATITTDELMDAELKKLCEEARVQVIVMDSLTALEDRIEEFFGHPEQSKPLRTMVVGAGFHAAILGLRGLGKTMMRDALVRHSLSMAYMEPQEDWYQDEKYHNWKDFIQNPARPGRQIKKQKPPKQSFKAQMRSVNRNR